MDQQTTVGQRKPFLRQGVLIAMGTSLVLALICFAVPVFLPTPRESLLKDPLRSLLTGVGVAGVAYPLWATGQAIKRRWASSPYFEGAFIGGVLSLFGLVCFGVALACLGFGVYDLVVRLLELEWP